MKAILGELLIFIAKIGLASCALGIVAADVILILWQRSFLWSVVAAVLFPVTVVVFPFYALIALGNWIPLWFTYVGPLVFVGVYGLGLAFRNAAR